VQIGELNGPWIGGGGKHRLRESAPQGERPARKTSVFCKEVEMKAIKLAGLVAALTSTGAFGVMVNYNISSPVAGATFASEAVAPASISWAVALVASNDTQGVATYVADIEILKDGALFASAVFHGEPLPPPEITPNSDFLWVFDYQGRSFGVGAPVTDSARLGGAGMGGVQSAGSVSTPGKLVGFGAGYAVPWDPIRGSGKTLTGNMAWGVGLDSRKSVLLLDPEGAYTVQGGYIDGPFPAGEYTVRVVPGSTNYLKPGLDLDQPLAGNFAEPCQPGQVMGSEFSFTVLPEPATMLLLVGGALVLRRRRA